MKSSGNKAGSGLTSGNSQLGMIPGGGPGALQSITPTVGHIQKYHHDWEKEKDDYLMKDIRDLLADPAPS